MPKKTRNLIFLINGAILLVGWFFPAQLQVLLILTIVINVIFLINIGTNLKNKKDMIIQQLKSVNVQQDKNYKIKSAQLETIVSNLPFPMALIDNQGNIILSNLLFQQFAVNSTDPLTFESKHLLPEIRSFVRNTYISEEAAQKTLNINTIDYQALSVPVYDKNAYAGCLCMFMDVTQILEGERVQKRFIADASHELRTPLSSIIGMIKILNRSDFNDEKTRKEFSHQIEVEAMRMETIIQDLLTLSKLSARQVLLELSKVKLIELVKDAYDPLKAEFREKDLQFEIEVDEQIELNVDKEKFHQVLINLLINALKFTEKGYVKVKAIRQDSFCILTITDTGVGIKKEDQKYIFERFYRSDHSRSRHSGGSGLGLAIVKSYLNAHKAEIEVTSEPSQGSCFTIKIPLAHS